MSFQFCTLGSAQSNASRGAYGSISNHPIKLGSFPTIKIAQRQDHGKLQCTLHEGNFLTAWPLQPFLFLTTARLAEP